MQHIKIFDSLRGLMAFWVVMAHTFMTFDLFLPKSINKVFNVAFAVEVFIILSGFVIFLLLDKKHEGYGSFILRRFFRLFPVYWFLLLLAVISLPLQQELWANIGSSGNYWQGRTKTILSSVEHFDWHLIFHIPLLQGIVSSEYLPSSDFAFIEPAWSLSLEWQFYLVAPLLFWGIKNIQQKQIKAITILLGAAVLISALYGRGGVGFLPKEMHFFIIGIASYYLWREIVKKNTGLIILIACLATAIVIRSIPLFIWFFVMTLAVSQQAYLMVIRRFFESWIFEFIGKISYPMYLIHTLVVYIPLYLNAQKITSFSIAGMITSTIILTILFSYLIHLLIEKPGMKLGKKVMTAKVSS
jgi:peptidoglycan/LPS O-acetylase OafA/YrhL